MIVVHQREGRRVDSAQPGQPAVSQLAAVSLVVDGGEIFRVAMTRLKRCGSDLDCRI